MKSGCLQGIIAPMTVDMKHYYYLDTMGCQMNDRDSETIAGVLHELGLHPTDDPLEATVAVLNTCAVREKPEHKVFSKLGELAAVKKQRPGMLIVVCGCVAQVSGDEIRRRAPYVDIIIGPRNLADLKKAVHAALEQPGCHTTVTDTVQIPPRTLPCRRRPGVSASVNITHGCNNYCAYCIVPYARGPEISRLPGDIVAESAQALKAGYREIMLLGQNVNSYGPPYIGSTRPDHGASEPRVLFPNLLRMVGALDGLERLRFTTSHPKDCSEELLCAMAETPAVCEHLHLPIQAGDDEVLRRMGRGYTLAHFLAIAKRARECIPGISISTDVMVGFPGETPGQFEKTLGAFVEIRFDQAFMFKYSDRPGTPAAEMADKVPEEEKQRRLLALVELQNEISRDVNRQSVGSVAEVLVESQDPRSAHKMRGRTRTNKLVLFPGSTRLAGRLVKVRLEKAYLWGFEGSMII